MLRSHATVGLVDRDRLQLYHANRSVILVSSAVKFSEGDGVDKFIAMIVAFGHSLLSMSGFETLAQVYREIAYPKLKNLRYTGNLVCIYSVVCTGVITLFACIIVCI